MTRSGDIVSLPYDLRIQFARYLVRTKLTQLKRYSFGKVKNDGLWLVNSLNTLFSLVRC